MWRWLRPGTDPDPDFVASRIDHHLAHWGEHGFGQLAVELDGRTVGWVGPAHPDFAPELVEEVEVGWALRPTLRGRGLATEAARAAIAAGFEHLPIERLISLIDSRNAASKAVAARLGMRRSAEVGHDTLGIALEVHELRRPAAGQGA